MQNVSNLIDLIFKDKENVNLWENLKNILNNNKEQIIIFCNIMKNKINSGNKEDILYSLNLVDFEVDNGSFFLWENIDSKDFLSVIVNLINNNRDPDLQSVGLYLINKLASKFQNIPTLRNSVNIFKNLKRSNVNFPNSLKNSYKTYLQKSKTMNYSNHKQYSFHNNNDNNQNKNTNNEYQITKKSRIPSKAEDYINNINFHFNQNNFNHKYRRLVKKLEELTIIIQEINVAIEQNKNINNNQNLNNSCEKLKKGQLQIIDCIEGNKLEDEKLMSICININEDIIMTLDRYARYLKGENPGPFLTSFSRNNNPYSNPKKIKENKTFVYGENKSNKFKEIDFGESLQSQGILENSLNVMFGNMEKSEVINSQQNNNIDENKHFFNEMSHVSNNGKFINNQNEPLPNSKLDFFNNSNLMIIGNKIINNDINNNNRQFNNNSFINQNFIENNGNQNIYNNFLLNNNKNNFNYPNNNANTNILNKQIKPNNNPNNNININNNIKNNNSNNNHNHTNIYKTHFIRNPYNLNNM